MVRAASELATVAGKPVGLLAQSGSDDLWAAGETAVAGNRLAVARRAAAQTARYSSALATRVAYPKRAVGVGGLAGTALTAARCAAARATRVNGS